MAVMSRVERWACTNPAWRVFTGRVVVPWVVRGETLRGEVLELGTGAGANAAAVLRRFPAVHLTATDVDPAMLAVARRRLARFGDRASVGRADASRLDFDDASFDVVISLLMVHHIGDWAAALTEVFRVLRPGGHMVGYDLVRSPATSRRHGHDDSGHNPASAEELAQGLQASGFSAVEVRPGLGGLLARFSAVRGGAS